MKRNFNYSHFSTGELLRNEINSGSDYAHLIKSHVAEGGLVPSEIILGLLRKNIESVGIGENGRRPVILLDGFPRNKENLDCWNSQGLSEVCELRYLIYFECSSECMTERILERSKTSGRSDDNPDTIKKRLKTFEDETKPILDVFSEMGNLITINAERGVEDIFSELQAVLEGAGLT